MLLRDIIDLDATYGAGPFGADGKDEADDPDADDRPTAGTAGAGASVGGNGHDQGDDALVSADRSAAPGPHASGNGVAGMVPAPPRRGPTAAMLRLPPNGTKAAKPPRRGWPRRSRPGRGRPGRRRGCRGDEDEAGPSLSAMEEASSRSPRDHSTGSRRPIRQGSTSGRRSKRPRDAAARRGPVEAIRRNYDQRRKRGN